MGNITSNVLPIEEPQLPFERPPLRSPRDDFFSVQRLDNIPEIETITPPVTPPPILPPVITPPVARPVIPPQPPSIGGIGGINQDPRPLERPIIPPRRDDFMSVERLPALRKLTDEEVAQISPLELQKIRQKTQGTGSPKNIFEKINQQIKNVNQGINQDPRPLERIIDAPKEDQLFISRLDDPIVRSLPVGDPIPFTPPTPDPIITTDPIITDPVIEPAPTTPAAVATDVGAVPTTTIPQDVRGQVDPVLAQQDTVEMQTDPLLRALYFGTADQPGFINQLQQATANLIGSDVPLQQTAGLSELEQIAQDRALADLGVAEPFVGESADLIRGTMRQFDPSMTQQFFNPFEDQVVQQTIQDVLEAGEKRDIQQRARDIQTGGLSAFGSRARLTAADRQEALGRGLAEALGGIRQAGFGQAQRDALTTFAQQRQAEQQAARDIGQVGSTLADLRARERAGLAGLGQTGRGIEETGLSRLFQQQLDQQGRPLQALQLTGQLLPQFQAGSTRIDSQYRLPADPTALGLGAAFNAYTANKPAGT